MPIRTENGFPLRGMRGVKSGASRRMARIAASLAAKLGHDPDPFLMAVAIGCACDFLTPIGHQCNTLVMGPGGYRFGDYWRLGLPLSVIVASVATALIPVFWPLG